MNTERTYTYGIPVNDAVDGGTVTVFTVSINSNNPVRRGALLRRAIRKNYGLNREQAKRALRAMGFSTIIT